MVYVSGGTFTMGCTSEQKDCGEGEKPTHSVTLSNFKIAKYELTQEQWRAVMGSDPPELNFKGCDNCPVERVSWNDIQGFIKKLNKRTGKRFRLPSEAEWEYAARGGLNQSPYPWGGPYIRNAKGCLLANFKPGRGNYPEDGGLYTVKTSSYWPNDYGLYNMAGNVSEWTSSAFYENAYNFVHDLNPDIRYDANESEPNTMKRKVIRGGSWKDIGYYLQTGSRTYEYQDTAKSYIGFRCVSSYLGRGGNEKGGDVN